MSLAELNMETEGPKDYVGSESSWPLMGTQFGKDFATSDLLAVGCYNNSVDVFRVKGSDPIQLTLVKEATVGGPVLDVEWMKNRSKLFVACASGKVNILDVEGGSCRLLYTHDGAVKSVRWMDSYQVLITGGWDKCIKFYDIREKRPVKIITLDEKCYCLDVLDDNIIYGTGNRGLQLLTVVSLNVPLVKIALDSMLLNQQHCSVVVFNDKAITELEEEARIGFALGGLKGRVGVQYVDMPDRSLQYSFRCHREIIDNKEQLYCVNDVAINPLYGSLATVGADGRYSFWDLNTKYKLTTSTYKYNNLKSCCFDSTGKFFAYTAQDQENNWLLNVEDCSFDAKPMKLRTKYVM